MYTAQQIADYINTTKPDLKDFLQLLVNENFKVVSADVSLTTDIKLKLFKAQITLIQYTTHPRVWADLSSLQELLYDNLSDSGIIRSNNNYSYYSNRGNFYISKEFKSHHIPFYLTEVKEYITPYLWNKVRTKTTKTFKQLNPDKFSLAVFKSYLDGLKKELPSTQVLEYINQIQNFEHSIKEDYLKLLVGHVSQPSWALQERLYNITPDQSVDSVRHFMKLNRYHIKGLVSKFSLLVPQSVLDSADSLYKPFITNVKRKPTTDIKELSALVGSLQVLKTVSKIEPNPVYDYFIEHIAEHLKHPEYKEPLKEYLNIYKSTLESMQEIINEFN